MIVDIQGIYHVTSIAGNPQGNIDFYAKVPGLIRASKNPCMYADKFHKFCFLFICCPFTRSVTQRTSCYSNHTNKSYIKSSQGSMSMMIGMLFYIYNYLCNTNGSQYKHNRNRNYGE